MSVSPASDAPPESLSWRIPVQMAEALWHTRDTERVLHELTVVAETDFDTDGMIDWIEEIVRAVWAGYPGERPYQTRRAFESRIHGLAFEFLGPSVNLYIEKGFIPKAAIFIWTTCLCCCREHDSSGFDTAIRGLSDHVIASASDSQSLRLVEQMCELLLPHMNWQDFVDSLPLWASICTVTGNKERALCMVETKLQADPDQYLLFCVMETWWDFERGRLSSLGASQCKLMHYSSRTDVGHGGNPYATHTLVVDLLERILAPLAYEVRYIWCSEPP